ncbi:ABC transporter permease [Paenibacillus cymbidii]|uniref:ABC transporter permease n=1 Tax=Paenibacillus cymbidii TaxID=1639034 RepID=UPI001081FFD7|nr:ABC-2 family transporter protein [Paenibacillus cymbidii]
MRTYVQVAKQSFHRKSSFKLEYYLGLFGSILSIFISIAIWSAVYGSSSRIADISQSQAITYAVLALLLRTGLTMNEFIIENKIRTGEIATELIRPYRFLAYLFSIVIGEVGFNIWAKAIPLVLICLVCIHLDISSSWLHIAAFMISVMFSYLLLYVINCIFWLLSFWVHQTWSMITIKNAIFLLVSGATVPYWFLPEWLARIFEWMPFKTIYFSPLSIVLGKMSNGDIWKLYGEQAVWILVFAAAGLWMWRKAQNKLVIQGG